MFFGSRQHSIVKAGSGSHKRLQVKGTLRNENERNDDGSCEKYYFSFIFLRFRSAINV